MGITSQRAAGAEAISFDEIREHLRVDATTDSYLSGLRGAALDWAETYTGRAIVTQTVTLTRDSFAEYIHLPRSPVASVTSVSYRDSDSVTQVVSTSVYRLSTNETPAVIWLKQSQAWPTTEYGPNAVTIVYVAGYGITPSDIPDGIRQAMLLYIQYLHDPPEENVLRSATSLLQHFRLGWAAAADGAMVHAN